MSKKIEEQKFGEQRFEFIFYINNHIICQRFFDINNYNKDSVYSLEFKELMDNIVGMNNGPIGTHGLIPTSFKEKTIDYLWENYNPYNSQVEDTGKNVFDKEDIFDFEIRVDKISVGKSSFSGNFFPTKVRYNVNIKEIIPSIMKEIRYYLSLKNYTFDYNEVELDRYFSTSKYVEYYGN